MAGRVEPRRLGLRLGVTDSVPKLLTARILAPLLRAPPRPHRARLRRRHCHGAARTARCAPARRGTGGPARADVPGALDARRRLLKSGLSLIAAPQVRMALSGDFPACLNGAPLLAGSAESPLSIALNAWLAERGLHAARRRALRRQCVDESVRATRLRHCLRADGDRVRRCHGSSGCNPSGRVPELSELLYLIRRPAACASAARGDRGGTGRWRAVAPKRPSCGIRRQRVPARLPQRYQHANRRSVQMSRSARSPLESCR